MAALGNEIIVRKRKYREDINQESSDESKNELLEFKKWDFSPASQDYLDTMIKIFEEMEGLEKHKEEWQKKQQRLLRLEAMLDDRLARDIKYRETRVEFQKLTSINILQRYSDYFKGDLHVLEQKAQQIAKCSKMENALMKLTWQEIGDKLEEEELLRKEWLTNYDLGIKKPMPLYPITDIIDVVADQALLPLASVTFQIKAHANRCRSSHSGIDDAIMQKRWVDVVNFIVRDKTVIQNGVLPNEYKEDKEAFITALEMFEKRYFEAIETREEPFTGLIIPIDYTKSETLLEAEKEAKAAKSESEAQATEMKTFQDVLGKAKAVITDDEQLLNAKAALIESSELLQKARVATKNAQRELGKREVDYKGHVAKYMKIEKDNKDKDEEEMEVEMVE